MSRQYRMFLTAEQIAQLTGYQKPALQRQWLAQNRYSFDVRADGRPMVSRAHYEAHHATRTVHRPSAPNLAALDSME